MNVISRFKVIREMNVEDLTCSICLGLVLNTFLLISCTVSKNVAEVISAIKFSRELLRFCWRMFQTKYVGDKVYILVTDAKKYHKLVNFVTYNVRLCHFYGTILIIFVKNDILSKKRYIQASGSNGWLLWSYFLPGLSFGGCEWSKWMVLSRV